MLTTKSLVAACFSLILLLGCAGAEEDHLSCRWLFVMRNMRRPGNVERTIALLPRAKAAGYNAIVLSDGGLDDPDSDDAYKQGVRRLQQEAKRNGLDLIPCVMPIGYSGGIIGRDPNLAEGVPVKDALFVVRDGIATLQPDPPVSLPGGDFEQVKDHHFSGWDLQDGVGRSSFEDHAVVHGGRTSVRMEDIGKVSPEHGHGRFSRAVKVKPFRQYHISAWIRTEDFEAPEGVQILVLAPTEEERDVGSLRPDVKATQDWTRYDFVFNSLNWNEVRIYFGSWGGKGGRLWWDDVKLEEIGLMNVLRRDGCPLSVRGENGAAYEEGRDFEPVRDPHLAPWEAYHEPPVIHLTADSRIKRGEQLRVSYYHSVVIGDSQVMCCLSEPKVYDILREQVQAVEDLLHPKAFFMQHDEIRCANWDEACQSRKLTPGQMLADNVKRCTEIIRGIRPDAEIWVWSDMFDPMHNAHDDYYLVNGTWAGSWEGLDSSVGVVNWYGELKGKNAKFFADRGHKQVLAGYYDHDEDGSAIAEWMANTRSLPGMAGAMYTTWQDKYDAMEAWAEKAWGGG